jgi:hypothetical protein
MAAVLATEPLSAAGADFISTSVPTGKRAMITEITAVPQTTAIIIVGMLSVCCSPAMIVR